MHLVYDGIKAVDNADFSVGRYLLGSVGHLKSLHLLHHVLGCAGDAGRHVIDDLGELVDLSLGVTLHQ